MDCWDLLEIQLSIKDGTVRDRLRQNNIIDKWVLFSSLIQTVCLAWPNTHWDCFQTVPFPFAIFGSIFEIFDASITPGKKNCWANFYFPCILSLIEFVTAASQVVRDQRARPSFELKQKVSTAVSRRIGFTQNDVMALGTKRWCLVPIK